MASQSSFLLSQHLHGRLSSVGSDMPVSGVAFDTRLVQPGDAFVAIPGSRRDGHDFIPAAFERGAALAVVSDASRVAGRPAIIVEDTRCALSRLAALFADFPSAAMKVVAVTGTNGKTTTNWLLYHAFRALGHQALRIGTLGVEGAGIPAQAGELTTPDSLQIHSNLRRAYDAGARFAVLEASSHALDQFRVDDVEFDAAIFTNLTRDHLDYHPTFEHYFAAKRKLFTLLARGRKRAAAVIHLDDEYGQKLQGEVPRWGLADFSFGKSSEARVRIDAFEQGLAGSTVALSFDGRRYEIGSALIGSHNAENLAAAFAAAVSLGLDPEQVSKALTRSPQVPGRLESVQGAPFGIFVDYAHTPDALENVLTAVRGLGQGNVWVLFGCGGDRDRGKRPQMAAVAARYADRVVVTSDNPRTEDPDAIIRDILSEGARAEIVEVNRRAAIRETIRRAKPGDVVLIAGKGHEDYQIIGTTKQHFSDVEEARAALRERGDES